ncbi:uncharacterized protein LOC9629856 isoform X2 [Selaginella moellendorffii]|uniref:uncharacterized protein LOC9629856 isoform X2 n=1 Tax=Selaginella moellendorffii TaxID=88036 RepID=UPI000D1CDD86|nr:uncharacterized protein LOC9629856 isoform X2 [Selaginella moellendorffii]|eukprot:XP_024519511.1 uncharacterized protein LOC9629856 isoform X2 [Selaginella moellendorffii]
MVVNAHHHRLLLERRVPQEVPRLSPHEQPLGGFIFFCNDETMPEDFERCLFGLPRSFIDSVKGIRKGLPLFLYNYSNRCLHGVFEASSDGGLNIEPDAWINKDARSGVDVSRYPAQVRVRIRENRAPLEEDAFRPVLFHYEAKKFRLELSMSETAALLKLFSNQRLESSDGSEWETVRGKPRINWPKPGPASSPRKRNGFTTGTSLSRADLSRAWRSSSNGEHLAVDNVGGDAIRDEVAACTNKMVGVLASESDRGEDGVECSTSRGSYVAALKSGMQPGERESAAVKSNGSSKVPAVKLDAAAAASPAAIMGRLHDPDPAVNSEITGNGFTDAKSEAPEGKAPKPWKQRDDASSNTNNTNNRKKLPLIQLHSFTTLPHVPLLTPIRFHSPPPPPPPPPMSEMDGFWYRPVQRDQTYIPGAAWSVPVMLVPPAAFSLPSPAVAANVDSNFGVLHAEILEFARTARPSPAARARAEAAVDCVRRGVKQLWPGADVEVFGSFATGLCLPHSDVDVVVLDTPAPPVLADGGYGARGFLPLIRSLAAEFKEHHRWCKSLMTIETASMPVIKLCCDPFPDVASDDAPPVAIDVTLGGKSRGGSRTSSSSSKKRPGAISPAIVHNGAAAREYVLDKLRQLPALAPLVLLMKSFLHCKGLNNVYTGGLGSFSLTLLLVFYLEQVPVSWSGNKNGVSAPANANHHSVASSEVSDSEDDETNLTDSSASTTASEDGCVSAARPPCQEEELISRAWRIVDDLLVSLQAPGAPNLGTLLIGFLHIFGQEFDFSRAKIVLKGSNGSSGGMFALEPSFQPTSLWIDDPLKPGMNVGAGSFAMSSVQAAMRDMLFVLAKPQQDQHQDQQQENHKLHQQDRRRNSPLPHLDQLFQVV